MIILTSSSEEIKIESNSTEPQEQSEGKSDPPNPIDPELLSETNNEVCEVGVNINSTKTNNLNGRIDVVRKSIFRSMKKYYFKEFKSFFDFTQKKKKYTAQYIPDVRSNMRKYISAFFGQENIDEMYPYILALIDNKQRFCERNSIESEANYNVNSLLLSYNEKKFRKLIDQKGFSKMLNFFLSKDENVQEILTEKKDENCRTVYSIQINYLIENSLKTLKLCDDSLLLTTKKLSPSSRTNQSHSANFIKNF